VDGRAGHRRDVGGRADVVGVEVGDQDAHDRPVQRRELGGPALLCIGQADPGVDERPPVAPWEQVGVHVAGPRRQRAGDAANPSGQLLHRSI
jgi:hypothetical protein